MFTKISMNSYIISDPNILGGDPVIKGTRVPVERIRFLLLQDFSISAIKNMYPHVSKKMLTGAIDEIFNKTLKTTEHAKASS